jgi:coenzyme F420-reducing hydrogenase delta subunit
MGRRVAHAQNYLVEIGLEPERLGVSRINAGDKSALAAVVAEIQARAKTLSSNPVRPVSSL